MWTSFAEDNAFCKFYGWQLRDIQHHTNEGKDSGFKEIRNECTLILKKQIDKCA